ncbi:MAG TPA: TSUP family transporter [Candidatus Thermoplasmatota archaeon]|nr:TSUP family transporter [Candidatus Thermoplasmatota archaeon]
MVDGLHLLFLVAVGLVSSFIDAQVGGGGVMSLPALLVVGLPGPVALGTNKLGGTASALVASSNYLHKKAVPLRQAAWLVPLSFIGGAIGVGAVLHSDATWLRPVIVVVMLAMGAYVLLRPRFGAEDHLRLGHWPKLAMAFAALDIGVYDGLLGPGTGTMLIFAIISFIGYGFRRAAALGRILNLGSNLSALAIFAWAGKVDWQVGIPMATAMALGGYLGSHVSLKHGDRYLKPMFVVITGALLVRLLWQVL